MANLSAEELAAQKRAKTDKRRYVRLVVHGGGAVTMTPEEVQSFMDGNDPAEYTVSDVWMTEAEFEALPEFQGF